MTADRGVVVDVELGGGSPPPPASTLASPVVYALLRWQGRPVGRVVVDGDGPLDPDAFFDEARRLAEPSIAASREETLEGTPPAEAFSVVVATRDRPHDLDACLSAIQRLDPPPGEIVVSDSASASPALVAMTARRHGARYVRCRRPGLSIARNTGARAARGSVLVFLDDDCRVDPGWLRGLRLGFGGRGADVVTGQLLPAELDTAAQTLFLRYSHMDRRGFEAKRFSRQERESKHWPIDAWRMGSGGNLAVRADAYWQVGGFRGDLGLGTPSLGGEDLYFLWATIEDGGVVVYRPDAMAWHRHHRSFAALDRVLYGYGAGHAAYLSAARAGGASFARVLLYRASFWYDRGKRLWRATAGGWRVPARCVLRELRGSLSGGRRYRKARRSLGA